MVSLWSGHQESKTHLIKTTPDILNCRDLSGARAREVFTLASEASPESHIVNIEWISKKPTMLYGYGRQQPNILSSLKDLNLPINPSMSWRYSLLHPVRKRKYTLPKLLTARNSWRFLTFRIFQRHQVVFLRWMSGNYLQTSRRSNQRINEKYLSPKALPQTRCHHIDRKVSLGMSLKRGKSQHTCEACGQPLLSKKTTQVSERKLNLHVELTNFRTYLQLLYM